MSLVELLSTKSVDEGLDNIFKSSAGPSTIVVSRPSEPKTPTEKRKSGVEVEIRSSKRARPLQASTKKSKEKGFTDNEAETGINEQELKEDASSSSEGESVSEPPEHESLKRTRKKEKGRRKAIYVPEGETREQRDARTIFIGNLPVAVVKSKPLSKQLKRHILSFVPSAKIESIRYRSVALSNPTTKLDNEDNDESPSEKQKRQQKRAADWREANSTSGSMSKQDKEEVEEDKKGEKKYMTPAEKRRLAAIKGDIHEHSAATTNAYVVFALPPPSSPDVSKSRKVGKEVMDPFVAARDAVSKIDGSLFAEHMLRVDLVTRKSDFGQSSNDTVGNMTDPKLSIFVGNLDFASSEDDVRNLFEQLMCEERGPPTSVARSAEAGSSEIDEENVQAIPHKARWVTRVRIVRDRETQLGKGFAYVQFSDRDCVDEVLALEPDKLKFAKRVLRVQRCKAQPLLAGKSKLAVPAQPSPKIKPSVSASSRIRLSDVQVPKGDPSLGSRLAGLPKESRKQVKATDPTRVARRLAKKKARLAMDKAETKSKRVRARKDKKGKTAPNTGRKSGKKRERSERNMERKNVKK